MIEIIAVRIKGDCLLAEFATGDKLLIPPELAKIYGIAAGKSIDPARFAQLQDEAERFRCRRKALERLAARSRSEREMETYLLGKGFAGECVREVTGSLRDAGYLDDFECAMQHIRARRGRKAVGKNLLAAELARRGIARELAARALSESGADKSDPEEVYACAQSRLVRLAGKKNALGKLVFFLNRRGFDGREVREAVNRLRREGFDLEDRAEESHDEGQ